MRSSTIYLQEKWKQKLFHKKYISQNYTVGSETIKLYYNRESQVFGCILVVH